jgi:hypothetical protein
MRNKTPVRPMAAILQSVGMVMQHGKAELHRRMSARKKRPAGLKDMSPPRQDIK